MCAKLCSRRSLELIGTDGYYGVIIASTLQYFTTHRHSKSVYHPPNPMNKPWPVGALIEKVLVGSMHATALANSNSNTDSCLIRCKCVFHRLISELVPQRLALFPHFSIPASSSASLYY